MYTISNIIRDIDRGCTANNMIEEKFSYRIVFFVSDGDKSEKHYADTTYHNLRKELENIIRAYLSLTNHVVVAQTTVRKDGRCVCLQSRPYSFSLEEYFRQIRGNDIGGNRKRAIVCNRQMEPYKGKGRIYGGKSYV